MKGDGKSVVWQKILGHYQSVSGANPKFNPNRSDPLWMTKYKLRRAIGSSSGGGGPVTCSDTDAASFLNTIGNTNPTITNAICTLVTSLKTAGVWTLMDAIYPFVGGTSASCAVNLRNPATFLITWHGGMTFSAFGSTGDGVSGYGDTGLNSTTATGQYSTNSATVGIDLASVPASNVYMCGVDARAIVSNTFIRATNLNISFGSLNSNAGATLTPASTMGMMVMTRTGSANVTGYGSDNSSTTFASTSVGIPEFDLVLMANNNQGSIVSFTSAIFSFFLFGAGLNSTQAAALNAAVKAFQTSLSRN